MTPENVLAAEPQPRGMGEFSRIGGVFFEPAKTFEDVARRPSFLAPLILVILSSLAYTFVLGQHIGWDRVVQQQMEMSPKQAERMAQMPADQQESARQMQLKFAPITKYAGSIVGLPILYLIFAGILLGIVRGIMSAPVRFKQIYAIMWYAALPLIVQTGLKIVVMLLKNPDEFNILNPLAFNPAAFMEYASSSKFLYVIAMSLDVFTIWGVVLSAIGLKAAGGKTLSFGRAVFAVALVWAIPVLLGATLAGIFS
jgi:hypothetical protein